MKKQNKGEKFMKRQNKGITLIALVITIIVLLLLAGVTIGMLTQNDGIIQKDIEAVQKYEQAQYEEEEKLEEALDLIKEKTETTWSDNGDGTFKSSTGVTVKIGQYVNYNPGTHTHTLKTENGIGTAISGGSKTEGFTLSADPVTTQEGFSWRILGVSSKGKLELISSDITTQKVIISGDKGYIHLEDNLNSFCDDLYGQGEFASGARSLNVEDINKITKYNPETSTSYGRIYQYRYNYTESEEDTDSMQYRYSSDKGINWTDWKNITSTSYQTLRLVEDNETIGASNYADPYGNPIIKQAVSKYYAYKIESELTEADGYTSDKISEILAMIQMKSQWLASPMVNTTTTAVSYYVPYIYKQKLMTNYYTGVGSVQMYDTAGNHYNNNGGALAVRPVVYLDYGITLTGEGDDIGSSADKAWTIERVK